MAQVPTLDGTPELILLHTEIESERRPQEFPFRMFEYYVMLRLRYRLPVFPVVLYLAPGAGGLTRETYSERLFETDILDFRYSVVGLPDLSAEDYDEQTNPLAPALSALMKPSPLGRVAQKAASLRRIFQSPLDEARRSLLMYLVETYTPLSATEEAEFREVLDQEEQQEVRQMINIYEERGEARGEARGEERGIVKGKRDALLKLLRLKFGELSPQLIAKVDTIQEEAELDRLLERLFTGASLDELGLTDHEKRQ